MNKVSAILAGGVLAWSANAQYTVELLHTGPWSQSACFGAAAGQQAGGIDHGGFKAMLWRGISQPSILLHDPSWYMSMALSTDGSRQVGHRVIGVQLNNRRYATIWDGSAKSWVDLHPPAYHISTGTAISGDVQVGYAKPAPTTTYEHAILWRNTPESAVVLHPAGADSSLALATDGTQHVGSASFAGGVYRAALWQGTSLRYVGLGPAGYQSSIAHGVAKGQQVGFASYQGNGHAALWYGSKESFVDLNPVNRGYNFGSIAYATNGFTQVGVARSGFPTLVHVHAAAWRGSRDSYLNLHRFLPPEYQGFLFGNYAYSEALGIDAEGVIVGYANHLPTNTSRAVLWRPIRR